MTERCTNCGDGQSCRCDNSTIGLILPDKMPIYVDNRHFNCGVCGCSHYSYDDAMMCTHGFNSTKTPPKPKLVIADEYCDSVNGVGDFEVLSYTKESVDALIEWYEDRLMEMRK